MELFGVKEGRLSVTLPMTRVQCGIVRVQPETQGGWNRGMRRVGDKIREVTRAKSDKALLAFFFIREKGKPWGVLEMSQFIFLKGHSDLCIDKTVAK